MYPWPIYRHTVQALNDEYNLKLFEYRAITRTFLARDEDHKPYILVEDYVPNQHQKNVLESISLLCKITAFLYIALIVPVVLDLCITGLAYLTGNLQTPLQPRFHH